MDTSNSSIGSNRYNDGLVLQTVTLPRVHLIMGEPQIYVEASPLTKDEWIELVIWAVGVVNPVRKHLAGAESLLASVAIASKYTLLPTIVSPTGQKIDANLRCIPVWKNDQGTSLICFLTSEQLSVLLEMESELDGKPKFVGTPIVDTSVESWRKFNVSVLSGVFQALNRAMSTTANQKEKLATSFRKRATSLSDVADRLGAN